MSKTEKGKRAAQEGGGKKLREEIELDSPLDQELKEVFQRFDVDKSGTVSVAELRHMLQLLGQNPTKSEVSAMVNKFDDNLNGQLDYEEFATLMKSEMKDDEERDAELRDAFAVFDRDDSGSIDRQELTRVLRMTGEKLNKYDIDKCFNAMDINGDGLINYEEFITAMEGGCLLNLK